MWKWSHCQAIIWTVFLGMFHDGMAHEPHELYEPYDISYGKGNEENPYMNGNDNDDGRSDRSARVEERVEESADNLGDLYVEGMADQYEDNLEALYEHPNETNESPYCIGNRNCGLSCHFPFQFDLTFTFMGLRPCGGGLDYAVQAKSLPLASPSWKIHEIKPDHHFAFELGLKVQTEGMCGCFMLDWEQFRSHDTACTRVPPGIEMIGPFFEIGPDAKPYTQARGKVNFKFDEVDLDYSLLFTNTCLNTNFYTGLSVARVERKITTRYSDQQQTIVRLIKTPSSFSGVGPHIGADLSYALCRGFLFTGGAAGALLVGRVRSHTTFDTLSPALSNFSITPPNRQCTKVQKSTQLVPAFRGKIGVGYFFEGCGCDFFSFYAEVGYLAQIYLRAFQSVAISNEYIPSSVRPDTTVGVFARTFKRECSDFALAGPYLTIVINF